MARLFWVSAHPLPSPAGNGAEVRLNLGAWYSRRTGCPELPNPSTPSSTNTRLRRRWLGTPGDAVTTECRFYNVWRILVTSSDGRHPGRNVCLSNVCQWQQQGCMSNKFVEFSSVFVAKREDKSEQKDFADAAT